MNAPIPKRTGAKNSGFNTSPHSLIDTIQLVTVVPILAPMMMPVACRRLIIPAFTKPTTITVVAELLWMIAVTPAPTSTPSKRFEVRISSTRCKRLPANFCRPSAIDSIPYRNIPSPPINANRLPTCVSVFIFYDSSCVFTDPLIGSPTYISFVVIPT